MSMDRPRWHDRGRLLAPDPLIPFAARAVKDPSIVYYDGAWHLFYTALSLGGDRSLGYMRSPSLAAFTPQRPHQLRFDPAMQPAAPFVFYHTEHALWYLIFQVVSPRRRSYIPVYATNVSLDPATWSAPRALVPDTKHLEKRRIDFWIIADRTHFFLFYWDNVGGTWYVDCPRDRFPLGFERERRVLSIVEPTWEIHEAGCIYWVTDQAMYLLLVESTLADTTTGRRLYPDERQYRFYAALTARDPRGPWYLVDNPFFARVEDIQTPGPHRWMRNVSHGEVLRSNISETPSITSHNVRFLIQSQPEPFMPAASFRYADLRWDLGLIELEHLPDLQAYVRRESSGPGCAPRCRPPPTSPAFPSCCVPRQLSTAAGPPSAG